MTDRFWQSRTFRDLYLSKLFLVVLALKIAAGACLAGPVVREWFAPFTSYFVTSHFANPWDFFFARGDLKVFPYPPGMLYILALPRLLLSPFLSPDWSRVGFGNLVALRLPMLLGDVAIYSVLGSWFKDRVATVRLWYWCSPVVFYICYFHGQLDIIPTALFMLCLYHLGKRRAALSVVFYALALSTKSHLWIALPFLAIYLKPVAGWKGILKMSGLCLAVYLALVLPYAFGPGYQKLVMQAEEQSWVFALGLPLGRWDTTFFLCPAALIFVLAKFASYPRQNWDLTILFLGIVFSAFVLLVPPMPGWFLWSIPFITYTFCRGSSRGLLLFSFSVFYLLYFLFGVRSDLFSALSLVAPARSALAAPITYFPASGGLWNSLFFTLMQSSLLGCVMIMYIKGVRSNDVYGARAKPLMVGIAGDSGVGKDRLARQLCEVLGPSLTRLISGDDYHRWERGDEHWKVLTHLNPRSNRLHEQMEHAIALRGGKDVVKGNYDHDSGRFTAASLVDPRQNVVVAGLHTFVLEQMRPLFDVRVFLDPDEKLRRYWKTRRDMSERGASPSKVARALALRKADRLSSVLPQALVADLVVRYRPVKTPLAGGPEPQLFLELTSKNSYNFEEVAVHLGRIPGVKTDLAYLGGLERCRLRVRGSAAPEDVLRVALSCVPNLADLVGFQPRFPAGLDGIVHLAILVCLSSNMRWKAQGAA